MVDPPFASTLDLLQEQMFPGLTVYSNVAIIFVSHPVCSNENPSYLQALSMDIFPDYISQPFEGFDVRALGWNSRVISLFIIIEELRNLMSMLCLSTRSQPDHLSNHPSTKLIAIRKHQTAEMRTGNQSFRNITSLSTIL
jgi:hypothetical protein